MRKQVTDATDVVTTAGEDLSEAVRTATVTIAAVGLVAIIALALSVMAVNTVSKS